MLSKLNRITTLQASLIIVILGFVVFFSGLKSPFQGDDILLIVNNVPVHSISHIRIFFEGSTFYNGQGLAPLSGTYYRPLQTTFFSIIYTLFGAKVLAFHLFQLLICVLSTIILYLLFRRTFKPALALFLSLIFLVHPLDSQVVFANTHLQDALFFFFGILALWVLMRFKSVRSLVLVALCLLLSLLSRESGILFVAMVLLYLFWFNRKRLNAFIGIMLLPMILYLVLRINAIGLLGGKTNLAPIDSISLAGRLFTAPSIMLFYMSKLIFPVKLASAYFWINPTFSVRHFLIPLIIDLIVVSLIVYLAILIRRRVSRAQYHSFLFFAIWTFIGILPYLQIIPLDMTACEAWFYFSMAGVLGMIGIALIAFPLRIRPIWLLIITVLIVGLLGFRTSLRGFDWDNQYTLARKDITASPEDYDAYTTLASGLNKQGNFNEAKNYALRSIAIFPTFSGYYALGVSYGNLGDFSGAVKTYHQSLKYDNFVLTYENLGEITLVYGNSQANLQYLLNTLQLYPQDSQLWMYLAILEDRNNNNRFARTAISNAASYGQVPQTLYDNIMNDQPLTINLGNLDNKTISIQ